jgi:hypothetical protein
MKTKRKVKRGSTPKRQTPKQNGTTLMATNRNLPVASYGRSAKPILRKL